LEKEYSTEWVRCRRAENVKVTNGTTSVYICLLKGVTKETKINVLGSELFYLLYKGAYSIITWSSMFNYKLTNIQSFRIEQINPSYTNAGLAVKNFIRELALGFSK